MATYTLISSNVLTTDTASITFSSIPSTYTDLVLRMSLRTNPAATVSNFYVVYNSDTSAIYSDRFIFGNGATATSSSNTANQTPSNIADAYINGATSTSNTFSDVELYVPNYTSTTSKPYSISSAQETNATTAYVMALAQLYRNTTAITSIGIFNISTRKFVSGSSFYLYGISNA